MADIMAGISIGCPRIIGATLRVIMVSAAVPTTPPKIALIGFGFVLFASRLFYCVSDYCLSPPGVQLPVARVRIDVSKWQLAKSARYSSSQKNATTTYPPRANLDRQKTEPKP